MAIIREGYKETEIGIIPEDWEVETLGNLTKFQGGYAFKSEDYVDGGIKLVKIANVQKYNLLWDDISYLPLEYLDKNKEYKLSTNDVVVAMTRPIISSGIKVCRITEADLPCLLNQRVGRFLIKKGLINDYLFQICFTSVFVESVKNLANTTGQPNISSKQIESIIIPVPPLPEQQSIAEILSTVDTHIDKLDNIIEDYQLLKKGMMKKLLTDGIGHTEFKETEIGRIPKEWEIVELGDLAEICYGKNQKDVVDDNGNYKILGTGGLMGYANSYLWDRPSVLIGRKGTINKPMYTNEPFWTVDTLFYTKMKDNVDAKWLYYYLNMIDLSKYNEATGVPSLNTTTLKKIVIRKPSKIEQEKIGFILSSIDSYIDYLDNQKSDFILLKKSLMEKLLTGKIRTSEIKTLEA